MSTAPKHLRLRLWSEEIMFLLGQARAYGTYVIEKDEHDVEHVHINATRFDIGRKPDGQAFCRLF